jgi:2-keto-3-deoxy-L-rhamnonate aldolase RhmA
MGVSLSGWPNDERHIAAVQRIFAVAKANGIVACHHGSGPDVSAKFVNMGSMLCQIGNDVRMLTAATAEALKTFRAALSRRGARRILSLEVGSACPYAIWAA